MKLNPIQLREDGAQLIVSCLVESETQGNYDVCYYINSDHANDLYNKALMNAFLISLIPNAVKNKENIEIFDQVSEELLYNIENYIIPIFNFSFHSSEFTPTITCHKGFCACDESQSGSTKGSATGFSAGVDSYHTMLSHFKGNSLFNIKYLFLINSYGSRYREMFSRYNKMNKEGAKTLGLPLITIDTNFDKVMSVNYYNAHSLYTLSAIYLFGGIVNRYYYASTYNYPQTTRQISKKSEDFGSYDHFVIPNLSTREIQFRSFGSNVTRMEKVDYISSFDQTFNHLSVCMSPDKVNCGKCGKCTRTLLSLFVLNKLEYYKNVFDIDLWKKNKQKHILFGLMHPGELTKEIIKYADQKGVYLAPKPIRILCSLIRFFSSFKSIHSLLKPFVAILYRGKLRI